MVNETKLVLLFSEIRRRVKHHPEQLNQIISQQRQGAQNH
jgi:flagellar biosynthesis chaperone FliJ